MEIAWLLIGLLILAMISYGAKAHEKSIEDSKPCSQHEWKYEPVDSEDQDGEQFLVCSRCGYLPNGMQKEYE